MNILITGVCGFIGSNLAKRLIQEGHLVYGIDNLSHGKLENIVKYKNSPNFDWEMENVMNWKTTSAFDIVVHLASEKIPRYSDSFATLSDNHWMVENMVDLAVKRGARLIFASTSDVYGKNEDVPFREDSPFVLGNTDVKRWAYAVSKIHSEHYIIGAHDRFGLDYTILRFFSCYGEHEAPGWWGGAQSAFIENILRGQEVKIHGSGMQSRCFTYIDDVIDGIMLAINKPEAVNQIFNMGNPHTLVTIFGLYELLAGIIGKYSQVVYLPYDTLGKYEDAKAKIPDIIKASEILGFAPKVNLMDGMTKTVNWHKKSYGHE